MIVLYGEVPVPMLLTIYLAQPSPGFPWRPVALDALLTFASLVVSATLSAVPTILWDPSTTLPMILQDPRQIALTVRS